VSPSHRLQLFTNCPRVGPFPRGAVLQEQAAPALVLPWGAVLQKQAAPTWFPHGVTSPASKPAPAWAPLSMGPQVLAGACSSVGLPTGSQPPSGIHLLRNGVPSTGYRWISAPLWTSMGCRGTICLTMVFITGCKGRLSALTFRAPPPSSFFTDLGVCRVVSLTSSHSSLLTAVSPLSFFLCFLKYLIPEALPLLLIGLALASGGSVLEPAGTGFMGPGGSFSQLLTEATPIAPLLPKLCHTHP